MDAGDRVPFRVVPLQKGADGGKGNGAVIASGKHGEGDGSKFHRLFLLWSYSKPNSNLLHLKFLLARIDSISCIKEENSECLSTISLKSKE